MQNAKPTKRSKKISGARFRETVKGGIRSVTGKLKNATLPMRKRLAEALKATGADSEKLQRYAILFVRVLFGFLMGIARLPQGIYPLGISALCSFSDRESVFFTYVGVAASCLMANGTAVSDFIIYFVLYAVRKAFTDSAFSEPLYVRILESTAAAMAIGIVRLVVGGEQPLYAYVAFLSLALVSGAFTYFFTTLFAGDAKATLRMSTRAICTYALVFALVLSVKHVHLLGFDVALVLACLITLGFAAANGFMHAGIVGFISGFALGDPFLSAALGLSGIAAAFLFSKGILAALGGFVATVFVSVSYSVGLGTGTTVLPNVLCASVLFFPTCGILPELVRFYTASSKCAIPTVRDADRVIEKSLSEALFSLSDVFAKLAVKKRYPDPASVSVVIDKSFSEVCSHCALGEMCYAKRNTDMAELRETLHAAMSSRKAEKEDFGAHMLDKCIRLDELVEMVDLSYRRLAAKCAEDNRPTLLSAEYAAMAHLFLDAEDRKKEEQGRDTAFEKSVADALKKADIPFGLVVTHGVRTKHTKVYGTSLDKFPFGSEEFKKYIFSECGIRVGEPRFDLSEKSGIVLEFSRVPSISFEYAMRSSAKKATEVSGDSSSFFETENGTFFALLCDGMGSGRHAAMASRLSLVFLEKLLGAGVKKSVCLELLNTALLADSDECFSTVDILEADTFTGKCVFVKSGAAPTYILRTGKLYRIFSQTPPVGILSNFSAESTRFDVEPDDLVIMLSDGAVRDGEDNAWIAELIRLDKTGDPARLATLILEKAQDLNDRKDDITAAVIRVKKA